MSIFNHLNKLKPFVPGLAGYGQNVFRDYVFQLLALYPTVGLLVLEKACSAKDLEMQ